MQPKNIFYAQSGGVTAVINASACGVIEAARQYPDRLGKVYAGRHGIVGALNEELIDTSLEDPAAIAALQQTPGGAFGSCRHKMKSLDENRQEYEHLIKVFAAHNIGYFFYNGGNDSQDTAHKIHQMSQLMNYPLTCIGIPKTVDNDLPYTDTCPGFGSVAKYIAISTLEASLDVLSMAATSTKVFILEVMGRHAGWIAAASGLAGHKAGDPPHIILFPEVIFNEDKFLRQVEHSVSNYDYCTVVVSEGVRHHEGHFLADCGLKDAFGHTQLGGVAPVIAQLIKHKLGYKYHYAIADYLQRAARHIASQSDVDQSYALGKAAVEYAIAGTTGVMLTIIRDCSAPYRWHIDHVALEKVANVERHLPPEFISENGFGITEACREYLLPLIQGEAYPTYKNGLPEYVKLQSQLAKKKLEKTAIAV